MQVDILLSWHLLTNLKDKGVDLVAISWQGLMHMVSAHVAKTERLEKISVFKGRSVVFVMDSQKLRKKLSTPSYKIRKEHKAGLLVSPREVMVIGSVDDETFDNPPASQSTAQPSAQAPAISAPQGQPVSYVTSDEFSAMNEKLNKQFARFEALLSRGNVFSTPKTSVSSSAHPVTSDTRFIDPSS